MPLYYYRDPRGNFGDDLNPWLWDRLLPKPLASCYDGETLLVGIGTLLNSRVPATPCKKVVFSSGVGYGPLPAVGPEWRFACVRGRRTAEVLGLPGHIAITDGAALVRQFVGPQARPEYPVSFMPHHRTARHGDWRGLCESLAIRYLDPADPVETTLEAIRRSGLVITEAMHGAIVADALRVPWIAVRSASHILEFKWYDWAESVGLSHRFEALPPIRSAGFSVHVSVGMPTLIVRDPLGERLVRLAQRGPKRLSPERVFRQTYQRLLEALDAFIEAA